jgi:hypothetical protein
MSDTEEDLTSKRNPRRRIHRRSTYRERNFWELAVIASLHSATRPHNPGDCASAAIQEADAALTAWRERWAESEPIEEDD